MQRLLPAAALQTNLMSLTEILLIVNIALTLLFALLLLTKKSSGAANPTAQHELTALNTEVNKIAPTLRDEISRSREESQRTARETREELGNSFNRFSDTLNQSFNNILKQQAQQNSVFTEQLQSLTKTNEEKIEKLMQANDVQQTALKDQVAAALNSNREETAKAAKDNRTEQTTALKSFEEKFAQNVKEFNDLQRQKFFDLAAKQEQLKQETENKLEKIRETMELKLRSLQEENSKKLDEMRSTVDEKLQSTVERRFNDSFKLISDRLEQVHKGLGEMQTLASGVGDLKKVLTNVKTRGNLGEVQLGAILEEIFSPDQYDKNASVKPNSQERVEYVIKLPGRNSDNQSLLLPIDSKFPTEDYQRLIDAYENMVNLDPRDVDNISKQFEGAVRKCARDIREKYINPPTTTDFAIMFVPTEGLYAEILRRAGLFETLRRDYKVTVVGPTNLVAFLNSLQMGFHTLAIEKRSSEVWEILGAVKSEFSNFGVVLEKTKKKLMEATNTIDKAGVRTRAIERQLRKVQELPREEATALIGQTLDMEAESIRDEENTSEEE